MTIDSHLARPAVIAENSPIKEFTSAGQYPRNYEASSSLTKRHHHGVTGRSPGLLEFYLSGIIQRVDVNGKRSSGSAVNMGAKLRWNSHITRLGKRLSSATCTVKRIRQLTDESTVRRRGDPSPRQASPRQQSGLPCGSTPSTHIKKNS
ncbi:hypothetical protein EVAR_38138_1 [Eumeta japonica]|uniref:Uncharacterized protein n=1 Tax=Eumeta variegata TaxID=151549 RepID=A0A4C1YQ96_EUMVA|nr:hypothetical protein EVAR_38138_1 [Eumeta japonica]